MRSSPSAFSATRASSSILETIIVQTAGNAGQSIAAGVIFTLPALIFLGFDLEYFRIFMLALIGGYLGVLFMVPLRRPLIVEEHGVLQFPEGTACADVIKAGASGGSTASRVFFGLGLGALYAVFQNENLFGAWPGTPEYQPDFGLHHVLKGASIKADATAEYLGVGYIIGARTAGIMFAGGVFSWLVLMPLHLLLRQGSAASHLSRHRAHRADGPQRSVGHLHPAHGRGSRGRRRTHHALQNPAHHRRRAALRLQANARTAPLPPRRSPSAPSTISPWAPPSSAPSRSSSSCSSSSEFKPVPGAQVGVLANLAASVLVVVFGFLFVTVSSRIVGLIGSSANPISGMTIATLMATSAIFLVSGWTAPAFGALAITIGGVVCIASAEAGDTSQDLKTGFLVGATPIKQRFAFLIGIAVSTVAIGGTLNLMNQSLQKFRAAPQAWDINASHPGVEIQSRPARPHQPIPRRSAPTKPPPRTTRASTSCSTPSARPSWPTASISTRPQPTALRCGGSPGIGSESAAAPQARLMATVINGILSRKLPWGLVMIGVFLVIAVELLGIRSLSFAVGAYLSIGTTLAIFTGGVVRWLVDSAVKARRRIDEGDISPGSLFASGLIAAGGIIGLLGVAFKATKTLRTIQPHRLAPHLRLQPLGLGRGLRPLAYSLYYFARKPLKK